MSVERTIKKLQRITREKEVQKNEHKWIMEEEVELLRKKEAKEELIRTKCARVLNIQLLAIRLLPHSPSSSECEEGKAYNERMQFVHTIIQDIYKIGTSTIEFLRRRRRGWSSNEQVGLGATLVDLMHIEE
jgi:hypothetical protein